MKLLFHEDYISSGGDIHKLNLSMYYIKCFQTVRAMKKIKQRGVVTR